MSREHHVFVLHVSEIHCLRRFWGTRLSHMFLTTSFLFSSDGSLSDENSSLSPFKQLFPVLNSGIKLTRNSVRNTAMMRGNIGTILALFRTRISSYVPWSDQSIHFWTFLLAACSSRTHATYSTARNLSSFQSKLKHLSFTDKITSSVKFCSNRLSAKELLLTLLLDLCSKLFSTSSALPLFYLPSTLSQVR